MKLIPLQGKYAVGKYTAALVDDDMYEDLSQFRWKAKPNANRSHVYAVRNIRLPDGRNKTIRMHRIVLSIPWDGILDIDHKDRNTINNCRDNLRLVTRSVNIKNTDTTKNKNYQKRWLCIPHTCRVRFGDCYNCGQSFRKVRPHQKFCSDSCKGKTKWLKMKASGIRPPSVLNNATRCKEWRLSRKEKESAAGTR